MLERGSVGFLNGSFCWVKGFWLAEDRLHARVSFDMLAGFSMAPCIWDRASGRHGLGTGGLLECRVCAFGWHAGGGLGGLPNGRYCWVKGFWLPGDHLHGRVLLPWWRVSAGFWSAGFAHLDGMLGGVLVGSKIAGISG